MTITEQTLTHEEMLHLRDLGLDTSDASLVKIFFSENDGCPVAYYNVYEDNEEFYTVDECEGDKLDVYLDFFAADSGSYDHSEKDENQVYTLYDILRKLPNEISYNGLCYKLNIIYPNVGGFKISYDQGMNSIKTIFGRSLFKVSYQMLCWLVENGHVK